MATGVQYGLASIEFKLLKHRYMRELKYKAGLDSLKHKQMMFMLFLTGAAADTKAVDAKLQSLEKQYKRAMNTVELIAGKLSEEELAGEPEPDQVSDRDRLGYLQMVNQDTEAFGSLSEIIEKIEQVQARLNQKGT